jgi:triosephosphate isomerase
LSAVTTRHAVNRNRGVLVSGNWKMNENHFESLKIIQELAGLLRAGGIPPGRSISIHPPFTSLRTVQTAVETDHLPIALGAQTCHFEDRGAYTGEVSAEMLAKLSVAYVIAGHSERRRYAGETDEIVRQKIDAIFRHGMRPILCVGESEEERADGRAHETVAAQLQGALKGRSSEQVAATVVAYEPLWAIGTGVAATPDDAQEMAAAIRSVLGDVAGTAAADCLIQYGGSVTPETATELLVCDDVDGLLVGGASLDASKFIAIVRAGT